MEELFKRQIELMNNNDIIICWFSIKSVDKTLFRFYFKEMNGDYIYNPVIVPIEGKPSYPLYDSFTDGLKEMIDKADEYILKKKK